MYQYNIKSIHRHNYSTYINFIDPEFRGCAAVNYEHEAKCSRETQAVTIIDNQKHADVDVELCYCQEDLCNEERNYGENNHFNYIIMLVTFISLLIV